jgi:nitric oxide reductase subunit C
VGPALDGVGGRFESGALRTWLADPASVKPGTTMPKLPLSDQQLTDLTSFLSAQR